MDPERALAILADPALTLAVFQYRVSRMVQDNVRADPARSMEASLLASRQRHAAADRLAACFLALLDEDVVPEMAPGA